VALLGTADDPKGTRGAVLAEFVIAILPILVMFFTFAQLAHAYTASLMLRHSAFMGARAAAVILPPNPGDVGSPEDIDRAVKLSLGNWEESFENLDITKTPAPAPYELVTVEVRASYKCRVPLGRLACGADSLMDLSPIVARYPNQGARYE
jgi:Flp pilus assembly protein TadG